MRLTLITRGCDESARGGGLKTKILRILARQATTLAAMADHVLCAPVAGVVQVMMILYHQKTSRILSSNVMTFSSDDDALLFTVRSLPRPVSWQGSHTKNVNGNCGGYYVGLDNSIQVVCISCACVHGFALLRDKSRKFIYVRQFGSDRIMITFQLWIIGSRPTKSKKPEAVQSVPGSLCPNEARNGESKDD
ncbi:hypothetical protein Tco_1068951 [Tanacetum coccineum]|uniref:Uncharacterized protein n=1 Tax=Tanacetum coccineum TaxID=301880 RepID=A0ABQ5HHC7_9ASTR